MLHKYYLNQHHVQDRAQSDAEEGVPLPDVKQSRESDGYGFGDPAGGGGKGDPFQTVYHQKADSGIGKCLPQIGDNRVLGFWGAE